MPPPDEAPQRSRATLLDSLPNSPEALAQLMLRLSHEQRETLSGLIREREERRRTNFIDSLFPEQGPLRRELYAKHMEFFRAGASERERAFMAANRVGKTTSGGGYELALHLMGDYPDWWEGRRFREPIRAWACGDTNETVREIIQPTLFGRPGALGTGLIRADRIKRVIPRRGSPDAYESALIEHKSGGVSVLLLKSYEQGRKAFQGTKQHVIWDDEEPPMAVYAEQLLRLAATTPDGSDWGSMMCTFTPLLGISEVVMHFLAEQAQVDPMPLSERVRRVAELDEPDPAPASARPKRDLMGPPITYEPNPIDLAEGR